jgi:hypothetical protein
MTTTINANTSAGLVYTADTSGVVKLQSNGVTTNALAYVLIAGSSSPTAYANSSYNVSSITYNAGGDYQVNFTNALAYQNMVAVTTNASSSTQPVYARFNSTSSCRVVVNGGANNDVSFLAFGN